MFFFPYCYCFKKYQTHTSWDRFFRSYVKEFDGWEAPSHAKQLDHFFPRHRFEIWEGPSDWLTVGRIAFFVLNKFGKTTPLVMHWLWVVGAILSIISRLGNPPQKICLYIYMYIYIGQILDVTTFKKYEDWTSQVIVHSPRFAPSWVPSKLGNLIFTFPSPS